MVETLGHFPGEKLPQGAVSAVEGERIVHWELSGAIYHASFHLADSVPQDQLVEWREARAYYQSLRLRNGGELTDDELGEMRRLYDEKVEKYLSAGHGCCALREPGVAEAVARVFERNNGLGYDLHLWTVMPNHLHVIASPRAGHDMKTVIDKWKSITAHAVAKLSHMTAPIWQPDHYSRIIRTPEEYRRQCSYVWNNPESARLATGFLRKRYD